MFCVSVTTFTMTKRVSFTFQMSVSTKQKFAQMIKHYIIYLRLLILLCRRFGTVSFIINSREL